MSTGVRILGGVATVLLLASCSLLQPTSDETTAPAASETEPAGPGLTPEAWDAAVDGLAEVGGLHAVWMGVAEWEATGDYAIAAAFPGAGLGQMEWHWVDSDGRVSESLGLGAGGELTVPIEEYGYQQAREFLDDVGECAAGEVRMWAARPMPSGVWHEYGGCAAENRVAADRGATPGLYNVVPMPQTVLLAGEPVPDLADWASAEALAQIWADGRSAVGDDAVLRGISISPSHGGVSYIASNGKECGAGTGFVFTRSLTPSDARVDLKPGTGGLVAGCSQGVETGFGFESVAPEEVARVAAEAITEHGLDLDERGGSLVVGLDGGSLVLRIGQDQTSSHTYVLVSEPAGPPR